MRTRTDKDQAFNVTDTNKEDTYRDRDNETYLRTTKDLQVAT